MTPEELKAECSKLCAEAYELELAAYSFERAIDHYIKAQTEFDAQERRLRTFLSARKKKSA